MATKNSSRAKSPLWGVKHTENQALLRERYERGRMNFQGVKQLHCAVCAGEFFVRYAGRFHTALYCSRKCRLAARTARRLARRQTPRACEHCNAPFVAKRSDARFCGDACRQAAHRAATKSAAA